MFSGSRNSKTLLRILPDVAGSRKSKLAADTPEAEERQFEHSFNLWRQHVASCLFQHAAFNMLLSTYCSFWQHVAFNMLISTCWSNMLLVLSTCCLQHVAFNKLKQHVARSGNMLPSTCCQCGRALILRPRHTDDDNIFTWPPDTIDLHGRPW